MKKGFKSQASSGRAGGFGGGFGGFGGSSQSSALSYVQEPLDYSTISDSHVGVGFKNLTKKDSTTKAKALEDLHTSVIKAEKDVEDPIVEIWVKQYPRLSIDSARRVRQLAHQFTGDLGIKCGKRIAKHLPQISGPWLAGTFDSDRSVAKAAQDALSSVFPSQEKIQGLRKTFQESIATYCKDALLNESVGTLSDERSISTDDAKATYARVVSTCIAVVTSLVGSLPSNELDKQRHIYEEVLNDKRFWEFASHEDASVRKSVHRLVQTCLNNAKVFIEVNLRTVSTAYVYKGLPSDQAGSSVEFVRTLASVTSAYPSIWTSEYSGKKPAISRFRQCLKNGAQGGPGSYWDIMTDLILHIPGEILPKSYDEISDLLLAARDGVAKREERFNASAAWPAYFMLVNTVTQDSSDEDVATLLEAFAMPVVKQYLHPADESVRWAVGGARSASLVSKVGMIKRLSPLLERNWPQLAEKLTEVAKTSQPEQSKDFDKSQKHVAAAGERWSALQREFYANDLGFPETLLATFHSANTQVLRDCIALLKTRTGKPYGAAAIIEEQLRTCSSYLLHHKDFKLAVADFIANDVPALIYSPSQRHLMRCLFATQSTPDFKFAFETVLDAILTQDEPSSAKLAALRSMFPANAPAIAVETARGSQILQDFLASQSNFDRGSDAAATFAELFKAGIVTQQTSESVLSELTESLSLSGPSLNDSLVTLQQLASANESMVRAYMSSSSGIGDQLLPAVLRLEQSADDTVAEHASALSARLTSSIAGAPADAKFGLILQNLEKLSSSSLPIEAVIDLATKYLAEGPAESHIQELMPSTEIWTKSILATLQPLKPSLALLSPLGGAVHLTYHYPVPTASDTKYDGEGLSQALRIAAYLACLLKLSAIGSLSVKDRTPVLVLLSICVLLAEDNTSIASANALVKNTVEDHLDVQVMEFVTDANAVIRAHWEDTSTTAIAESRSSFFSSLDAIQAEYQGSTMAYYAALASAKAHDNFFELHGYTSEQMKAADEQIKAKRSANDAVSLVSYILGFSQPLSGSQVLTRYCNELVADLTDLDIQTDEAKGLKMLVLLNQILHTQPDFVDSIAKTRLIFVVKHIMPWLESDIGLSTKSEVCKALTQLLPGMSDMYGEHWKQLICIISGFWSTLGTASDERAISEDAVLVVHATLRLYTALRKSARAEEPNDDLVEALKDNEDTLSEALIAILRSVNGVSDEAHQPLMVTNELLARQISQLPSRQVKDTVDLFPLLYTPSIAVQGAAFNLLHQQIPQEQEKISFDAALDNKKAQLPDELLSLIIDAPTLDSLANSSFESSMPLILQGYLFSWRLVFDHFNGSSQRVKEDYIEQLKEGGYITGLLELAFDFMGHTRGRPIDASAFNPDHYTPGMESSPEKEVQALLTHLFYLSLAHLPSLVKNYLTNEIRSRQAPKTVEAWTAKYISPLIIASSLQSVIEWNEKTVKTDPDYESMSVKVNTRGREVNVSYQIDEQTMAMKIVLPEAYPLQNAKTEGINRVAVSEQKWRSWLMNCQGTITFSNGSITDALSAWRKNVAGTLKGHVECAICYSIINEAKELPTKRCPTCKNVFHNQCLFKWFRSSNSSTCPLCRQPYHYN